MNEPLKHLGVARTSTLLAQGWSKSRIKSAIASGRLTRPQRGWVARPGADPELLIAVRHGVLLSCITQARRLGLWVFEEPERHFSAREGGSRKHPIGVTHWRRPLVPRDPDALADPLENVLDAVAHCRPLEEAVAVWDSALNRGLVEWLELARLPLRGAARDVLAASNRFADSGLESYVRMRLSWLNVRIVSQAWVHGHRVDFLIGHRLVLQIDGSQHAGEQRTRDNQHDALLSGCGYTVIRVGYWQVVRDWPGVQQLIMRAVARGQHLAA